MPDSKQKLDRFTASILKEAAAESEQARAVFEERRRKALAEAREQANAEARAYRHSEISRLRAEAGQQVSRRMQESKQTLFRRRNEIAEEVFDQVRQRIAAYAESGDYVTRLEELLQKALSQLDGADHIRIYLRERDRGWQSLLRERVPEVQVTFLEGSFQLGGLIVEAPDLGLRVDASFDSRLQELRSHFAELFGISLADMEEEAAR